MTVDIATLAIRIDSTSVAPATANLDRMRDAGGRAEQQTTALESATRKLQGALALLGVGAGVGAIIRMADEYTKFTAQLRLATESQREYAAAVDDVRRIANTAQQDLAATGVLYARIANGTRELGVAQKQVASITEVVNLALKVSGATAQESASAMLQLSQSFASGTLRGEEFNAVNEAAPRLMKALADGLGVPIGALKQMASDGLITSKVMADVLPQALQQLQAEAKQVQTISGAFTVLKNQVMEFTAVQAQSNGMVSLLTTGIETLANNLVLLTGVVSTLVAVNIANWLVNWTTKTYERIAAAYAQVAAENAARAATIATAEADLARATASGALAVATQGAILVAREEAVVRLAQARSNILAANSAIEAATAAGAQSFALRTLRLATAELAAAEAARAAMVAELALLGQQQARVAAQITAATAAQTVAQTALNTAGRAGVATVGLAGRAMGLLGGPVGAVITVLGLAATAWSWYSSKSSEANTKTAEETEASTAEVVAQVEKQIAVMERRNKLALSGAPTTATETPLNKKLADVIAEIEKVGKADGDYANLTLAARQDLLMKLGGQYGELTSLVERFNKASVDGAGNTAAAKALIEIRQRQAGVGDQYIKDLNTYQTALDSGVISLDEYKRGVTALAVETYKNSTAGKASSAGVKAEQTAYQTLLTSIQEKIAANKLEMSGYNQLSDSQKLTIKLDAEISTGKTKLNASEIAHARSMIAVVAASDAVIASNKRAANGLVEFTAMQKAHDEQVAKSIQAANDEASKSEELVVTFGMTKAAIEQLELARLQDQLAQRASTGMTLDEIAALEKLIVAKQRNVAAVTRSEDLSGAQKSAEDLAQFLDPAKAQSFGDALRDAFGGAGNALVKLTSSFQVYAQKQAEFEKQRGNAANKYLNGKSTEIEYTKDLIAIDKMQTNEKLGNYGDMAGAAASFFSEQSNGYKVLQGVSQAFHLAQLAMNLASIAPAMAAGAAQFFAQSGWGGFAGVAAMAAVVAGFGVAVSGGGGGGSSSKQRQETQGTGSVFGDNSAKSDSITRAIELAATNSSIELTHTAGMLASLKSIENSIGGLGNLLVRGSGLSGDVPGGSKSSAENLVNNSMFQLAFGGVIGLAFSKLDQALGGWGGKLASSIFGGKVTALDTGLTTKAASLGSIATNGLVAQQYTDTKKSGGWFSSDKYSTLTTDLGAEANDQFAKVILGLSTSIKTAADLLGVGGDDFTAKLNSFVVDIGKISLKDLKGEEIQAALEAVFSKLGDDMAQFGVAGLEQFQQVGEGYFETLTRVATNYANLNSILESIGTTFGATGMSSIAARERLIDLAGGIDELASQTTSFADSFLSKAEQLAPVQKYVTDQLAAMGLQGVDTRDKFKDVVLGLANSGALATEAGAKQYTALLALADAFAKTHAATEDLTKTEQEIADERKDLQKQYNELTMNTAQLAAQARSEIAPYNLALYDQIKALQAFNAVGEAQANLQTAYYNQRSALQEIIDLRLKEAEATEKQINALKLGALSALSPEQKYLEAQRQFDAAAPGDAKNTAAQALLQASRDYNGSTSAYVKDYAKVQAALALQATSQRAAATIAQQQLDALTKQISELVSIDAGVSKLDSTISELNKTMLALGVAMTALAAANTAAGKPNVGNGASLGQSAVDTALTGIYKDLLGRAPDAEGLKFWETAAANGATYDEIVAGFKASPEYQALQLKPHKMGGIASGPSLVGEEGAEALDFASPARVYPAGQTSLMFANGNAVQETQRQTRVIEEQNVLMQEQNDLLADQNALLKQLSDKAATNEGLREVKQYLGNNFAKRTAPA